VRHVMSTEIVDFREIYKSDVEMVSVIRKNLQELEPLAQELVASRNIAEMRWEQAAISAGDPLRSVQHSMPAELKEALSKEVALASNVLNELLGCSRIGVRMATLSEPMCPRFHVDHVPCRLLTTITGPATEWIASEDVIKSVLADTATVELPVRSGGKLRQLPGGCWSLLKGGSWQDEFQGVVHRSPHQDGERLLISFDPIFSK
jgi:hypothetical protein